MSAARPTAAPDAGGAPHEGALARAAETLDPKRPHADVHPARRGRRQFLFLLLASIFLTNAIIAEMIGGKLFAIGLFGLDITLSCGVLLWPVVFIVSDIINEYFGRRGVRTLSLLGAGLIAYAFVALYAAGLVPAVSFSPVPDAAFNTVFQQSRWIIVGSIAAFLIGQLLDVTIFWMVRNKTGPAFLWLRATGSTIVSQLVDTFVVGFIGLHLPFLLGTGNGIDFEHYVNASASGYVFKFVVAVAVTPVLYAVHGAIDRWLGPEADDLIEAAAAAETHAG